MKKYVIAVALMGCTGCANHAIELGPMDVVRSILAPDPNALTAEDKEIMRREQAEQDALEKAK